MIGVVIMAVIILLVVIPSAMVSASLRHGRQQRNRRGRR